MWHLGRVMYVRKPRGEGGGRGATVSSVEGEISNPLLLCPVLFVFLKIVILLLR